MNLKQAYIETINCKGFENKETDMIIYNGYKFYITTMGYYNNRQLGTLHRYKWKIEKGEIPNGYVIHHKDEDKFNNDISNLKCITSEEHKRYHMEGEKNHNYNRTFSKDHKDKLSVSHMGNIPTKETRAKLSKAHKGIKMTEKNKQRMSILRSKKIICLDTGKLYKSMKEAKADTGIFNIGMAANGQRNTAGGLRWQYL